jgi:hypothetical protein
MGLEQGKGQDEKRPRLGLDALKRALLGKGKPCKERKREDFWADTDARMVGESVGYWLKQLNIPVFCINLKSRPDRLAKMKTFFEEDLGIAQEQVNLVLADRHPVSGALGCLESHMQCWITGQKHYPGRPLLVFEDDIALRTEVFFFPEYGRGAEGKESAKRIIKRYLSLATEMSEDSKVGATWDVLMLDYDFMPHYQHDRKTEVQPNFFRITALSAGCYILHPHFIPRLLINARKRKHVPVDLHFATLARQVAHLPVPFMQQNEISDIDPFHTSGLRTFGQKRVYPALWFVQKNPQCVTNLILAIVLASLGLALWSQKKQISPQLSIKPAGQRFLSPFSLIS